MAVTGTPRMVTDGLVLYLDAANVKSYPGSGTTWTDLSSTAITGSLTNGPTFSSNVNGAIVFDGTNDNINLGDSDFGISSSSSGISISTWVLVGRFQSYSAILSRTSDISPYGGWQLNTNNDGGTNKFDFAINAGGTWRTWVSLGGTFSTQPTTGVWYHICGTYNKSTISLYQNGVLLSGRSAIGDILYSSGINASWIGRRWQTSVSEGTYFSGSIASLSVYNRALSASEISQNFEATRERFGV